MKNILCFALICFGHLLTYSQPGGNKNGYSREGAKTTSNEMNTLFIESFLFSKGTINMPGEKAENRPAVEEAITNSDYVIKEFEQKVDEFLKSKPSPQILKSNYNSVVKIAQRYSSAIKDADDGLKNWKSLSAISYLQNLYLYKAYITAAIKVYPEAISLQENIEVLNDAINGYGTKESYMQRLVNNKIAYIKSLKMKPAAFKDASIEKMVKSQYENTSGQDKLTVTHVHITTLWTLEKNTLDIPISKEAEVNMAIKRADGTCGFATGRIRQEYKGGGNYSVARLIMPSPVIVVPCENLPK
jgi:hypothetical protein